MSHADPTFAIPAGVLFAAASIYVAMNPHEVMDLHDQGLRRLFGDRWAAVILQVAAIMTAGMTGWLALHEAATLIGG